MADIFLYDMSSGRTTRVSVAPGAVQGNDLSASPFISADGRYVAFYSYASTLVAGDTNGRPDVFVSDLQSGLITRVSVDSNGVQADSNSAEPAISTDGRYIAFESTAMNLVAGDTNGTSDVFLRDMQTGITTRSASFKWSAGNNSSSDPSISPRWALYSIQVSPPIWCRRYNGFDDIFVHDLQTDKRRWLRLLQMDAGRQGVRFPSLHGDGQFIVFRSHATNLATSDTNVLADIFIHGQEILPPIATATYTPTLTPTFTPSPTPTNTPTPTAALPPSSNSLYLSLTSSQTIAGIASGDEDILRFDGTNWGLFFDGSDVGVGSSDLFAFSILDADTILMAFGTNVTVNGIAATPQDVLRFDATSLGSTTAGAFSLYFNGSDVGFDSATNEKIDSLSLLPDGRLLISTNGNPSVPGLTTGKDEDVLAFSPASLGDVTSGTWSLYFDGSDVGLSETSGEDIDA
jgi:hypothetical protein